MSPHPALVIFPFLLFVSSHHNASSSWTSLWQATRFMPRRSNLHEQELLTRPQSACGFAQCQSSVETPCIRSKGCEGAGILLAINHCKRKGLTIFEPCVVDFRRPNASEHTPWFAFSTSNISPTRSRSKGGESETAAQPGAPRSTPWAHHESSHPSIIPRVILRRPLSICSTCFLRCNVFSAAKVSCDVAQGEILRRARSGAWNSFKGAVDASSWVLLHRIDFCIGIVLVPESHWMSLVSLVQD